jgi:hypothetical protein
VQLAAVAAGFALAAALALALAAAFALGLALATGLALALALAAVLAFAAAVDVLQLVADEGAHDALLWSKTGQAGPPAKGLPILSLRQYFEQ